MLVAIRYITTLICTRRWMVYTLIVATDKPSSYGTSKEWIATILPCTIFVATSLSNTLQVALKFTVCITSVTGDAIAVVTRFTIPRIDDAITASARRTICATRFTGCIGIFGTFITLFSGFYFSVSAEWFVFSYTQTPWSAHICTGTTCAW
jgi:hypothetical protein